jgi:hypothetical protein
MHWESIELVLGFAYEKKRITLEMVVSEEDGGSGPKGMANDQGE